MNYLKATVKLGILIGFLGFSHEGWAYCYLHKGGNSTYILPDMSINIKGGVSKGTIGGGPIRIMSSPVIPVIIATGPSGGGTCHAFAKYIHNMQPTGIPGVVGTNVQGIGIKIYVMATGAALGDNYVPFITYPLTTPTTSSGLGFHNKIALQFYITGPVGPGDIYIDTTLVSHVTSGNAPGVGSHNGETLHITSNKIPIIRGSCHTPNIKVVLNKHERTYFKYVNATSPAVLFNFDMSECSAGMGAVSYTFRPAGGITLKNAGTDQQHITLNSASTAQGVGIQLLYENETLVPFNQKIKYTGYNNMGGHFYFRMKARYIRTGSVKAGTANSAVEFVMNYE